MKVLTIKTGEKTTTEVYTLNPGEVFPNFGGSRHGISAKKTASLIIRIKDIMCQDLECDIYDKNFWDFIAKCINSEIKAEAIVEEQEQKKIA